MYRPGGRVNLIRNVGKVGRTAGGSLFCQMGVLAVVAMRARLASLVGPSLAKMIKMCVPGYLVISTGFRLR